MSIFIFYLLGFSLFVVVPCLRIPHRGEERPYKFPEVVRHVQPNYFHNGNICLFSRWPMHNMGIRYVSQSTKDNIIQCITYKMKTPFT